MSEAKNQKPILVTGATGYVGGRLVGRLLEAGYRVRAMGRSIGKLQNRPWAHQPNVELVVADIFKLAELRQTLKGCRAAYYLVHSMLPGQSDFAHADRQAAQNMVTAAAEAGLERIIYLGGLGDEDPQLSKHLRSRGEVAGILKQGPVPVTELRAAMIIGSGSASFEILRYLVERLPVMITPRWLKTPNQPIAIRNVLTYLSECLEIPQTLGETFDIGGEDVLTYHDLMKTYAEVAGLRKRLVFPVPVLTPRLSSYWIHFVTPVPASLARPLAEGLKNPVVCRENRIREIIPQKLLGCREAIDRALARHREDDVISRWTDAGRIPPVEWSYAGDPEWAGGTLLKDERATVIEAAPEEVWDCITRIGGEHGWYHADFLWRLRGAIDRMIGGVGLRRGRRDRVELKAGDALDFWRVVNARPPQHLLLVAEMKLPGKATLEFEVQPKEKGFSRLIQTARFKPQGLAGLLYWYAVSPFHAYVFKGMLTKLARKVREKKVPNPGHSV